MNTATHTAIADRTTGLILRALRDHGLPASIPDEVNRTIHIQPVNALPASHLFVSRPGEVQWTTFAPQPPGTGPDPARTAAIAAAILGPPQPEHPASPAPAASFGFKSDVAIRLAALGYKVEPHVTIDEDAYEAWADVKTANGQAVLIITDRAQISYLATHPEDTAPEDVAARTADTINRAAKAL